MQHSIIFLLLSHSIQQISLSLLILTWKGFKQSLVLVSIFLIPYSIQKNKYLTNKFFLELDMTTKSKKWSYIWLIINTLFLKICTYLWQQETYITLIKCSVILAKEFEPSWTTRFKFKSFWNQKFHFMIHWASKIPFRRYSDLPANITK